MRESSTGLNRLSDLMCVYLLNPKAFRATLDTFLSSVRLPTRYSSCLLSTKTSCTFFDPRQVDSRAKLVPNWLHFSVHLRVGVLYPTCPFACSSPPSSSCPCCSARGNARLTSDVVKNIFTEIWISYSNRYGQRMKPCRESL